MQCYFSSDEAWLWFSATLPWLAARNQFLMLGCGNLQKSPDLTAHSAYSGDRDVFWARTTFPLLYSSMGGVQSGEGGRHGFHVLKVLTFVWAKVLYQAIVANCSCETLAGQGEFSRLPCWNRTVFRLYHQHKRPQTCMLPLYDVFNGCVDVLTTCAFRTMETASYCRNSLLKTLINPWSWTCILAKSNP